MELCEHLREIYQKEIENGNTVVAVGAKYDTGWQLVVFFAEPHAKIKNAGDLEISQFAVPWYPAQESIICRQCKMELSFPIEKDQQDTYDPGPDAMPDNRAIATRQTLWVDDSVSSSGIVPIFKGEERGKSNSGKTNMELCEHLRGIYQKEIQNGNTVLSIGVNYHNGWKVKVYFSKPHTEIDHAGNLKIDQCTTPFYPPEGRIVCWQCKMRLSFPVERNAKNAYAPDPDAKPDSRVIATRKTLRWDDGVSGVEIVPIFKEE
ncbi:MAG: hypothetical protein IJ333_10025 [Clostridia bacterium]|nr:hypothetical protein [Clostridia bacterium]